RPFEPGQSGNPSGRPKGSRNKATALAEKLLDGESEAVLRKLLEMALAGDSAALRLCLDRILPPRRDRLVTFALPEIKTAADACAASAAIIAACANGELTPSEAVALAGIVAAHVRLVETTNLEARLADLEARCEPSS